MTRFTNATASCISVACLVRYADLAHELTDHRRLALVRHARDRQLPARCGEGDVERRALPHLAVHSDVSAHAVDEGLHDVEAEPGAAVSTAVTGVGLPELVEATATLLLAHADAVVSHRETDQAIATDDAHLDGPVRRAVLHRVVDEVIEQRRGCGRVRLDRWKAGF